MAPAIMLSDTKISLWREHKDVLKVRRSVAKGEKLRTFHARTHTRPPPSPHYLSSSEAQVQASRHDSLVVRWIVRVPFRPGRVHVLPSSAANGRGTKGRRGDDISSAGPTEEPHDLRPLGPASAFQPRHHRVLPSETLGMPAEKPGPSADRVRGCCVAVKIPADTDEGRGKRELRTVDAYGATCLQDKEPREKASSRGANPGQCMEVEEGSGVAASQDRYGTPGPRSQRGAYDVGACSGDGVPASLASRHGRRYDSTKPRLWLAIRAHASDLRSRGCASGRGDESCETRLGASRTRWHR